MNYRDEAVRVADLALTVNVVEGCTFDNCLIIGPGMLFFMGETVLDGCAFTVANVDELVIEAPHTTVGAIAISNSIFRGCTFIRIGIVGPKGTRADLMKNVSGL